MVDYFSYRTADFILTPFYIIFIFIIGYYITQKKQESNPLYKYFVGGLMAKVFASVIFLIIYTEYYGYGDTIDYVAGSIAMSKLMVKDFWQYLQAFFNFVPPSDSFSFFNTDTSYPEHFMWMKENSKMVICLTSLFANLGFRCYMPITVLMAFFSYLGVWKLFLFFTHFYNRLHKQMAIAVLFVPSVVFWGSGVLKDTYTFAAASWFLYSILQIFIKKEKVLSNIVLAIINIIIILTIKPYILIALLPGVMIWIFYKRFYEMKNKALRIVFLPFFILIMLVGIGLGFSVLKKGLGEYSSLDKMMEKAKITQEDLMREESYGKNFYYVGKLDGTTSSMLKAAPMAVIAGLYRPFIWEVKNPVMMLSGIENLILMLSSIFLLIRLKPIRFIKYLFSEPILILSVLFSIFFMYSVGLASANFGALVRYKIPAVPFFVAAIFIMLDKYRASKIEKFGEDAEDMESLDSDE